MKKILAILFALTVCSTAQSKNFFDISYNTLTDLPDGVNVDGYGLMYSSVEDNITFRGGYMVLDITDDYGYGFRGDAASFGGDIGVESFAAGTFYGGADLLLVDGDSDVAFSIGYSKRKIDEFSYDFAITHSDGESTFGASIRLPVSNGGGIQLGIADSDFSTAVTVGYSFGF